MIIDFRLRPPYKTLGLDPLWIPERREGFNYHWRKGSSESIEMKSMELLIKEMDALGVDKGVVPVRIANGMKNEDLAELLKEYAGRFIGFIGVTPWEMEKAFADIQKHIIEGEATGVFIEPGMCTPKITADDEIIYPIYEKCQELNIPVLLSFGGFVGGKVDYNLPSMIDRVAVDFPNLIMIIGHAGWPYVVEMSYVAFNKPNVYLSPDIYAVDIPGSDGYIRAMNGFISEKMIFGSAYPAISLKDMIDAYKNMIDPEFYEQVMYKNAMKVLKLH